MGFMSGLRDFGSGLKDTIFGGAAGNNMPTKTQTGEQQRGYLTGMLGRSAPQMDATQANQSRGQMQGLASQLQAITSGGAKGAGEMAVDRQVGQATAAQQAQAQMARGANAALAARTAARTTADLGVTGTGMAQQAALQDQSNAQGQLAGLLGNMRQGDIGVAGANQQAQMQQQQVQLGALAQMLGVDRTELDAAMNKANVNAQDKGILGGLIGGAGAIGAAYAGK